MANQVLEAMENGWVPIPCDLEQASSRPAQVLWVDGLMTTGITKDGDQPD